MQSGRKPYGSRTATSSSVVRKSIENAPCICARASTMRSTFVLARLRATRCTTTSVSLELWKIEPCPSSLALASSKFVKLPLCATAIEPAETGGDLHDRLSRMGAEAVVEAVDGWAGGRLAPVPQPDEGVTYAAKIAKQEAVIDWTRPAAGIDRQVRAFNPWPVAETTWRGRQLRIWSGRPVDVPTAGAVPGGVIDRDRDRLVVATGVGAYEITRVQLAGRNALPATEFLRAHDLAGECLGR